MTETRPLTSGQPPRGRIIVRGVNWLGDAVMTTPALLRLREARRDSHITLLTHEKLARLWAHHPAVDTVLDFASGEGLWAVAQKIRAGRFDVGLLFPNSPRSALELRLGGVRERIGFDNPLRNWLLTERVARPADYVPMHKRSTREIHSLIRASPGVARPAHTPGSHQIHHYLRLVATLGADSTPVAPLLAVADSELEEVQRKFAISRERPMLGLNAGAEYGPAKRWPKERFIAAVIAIQKQIGCRWMILGGPADVRVAEEIAAALKTAATASSGTPPLNLAGQTSLRELCAVLKLCRLLLTNDTGPMHIAAALSTPVVVPFGSTSPELTGPGLPGDARHRLLKCHAPCSPCFLRQCPIDFRCMTGITVQRVVEAVLSAVGV